MTDAEILAYFRKHKSGVCGRFEEHQLANPLLIPQKKIPWLKYFFTVSLPALLFTYKGQAQRLAKKNIAPVVMTVQKQSILSPGTKLHVTGKIVSASGLPVPYASVMISGSTKGTVADSAGYFSLQLDNGERFLEVSAVAHSTKRVPVYPTADAGQEILLEQNINLENITIESPYL
jgi:CarboxypepD_reg-like domain